VEGLDSRVLGQVVVEEGEQPAGRRQQLGGIAEALASDLQQPLGGRDRLPQSLLPAAMDLGDAGIETFVIGFGVEPARVQELLLGDL
jgi:hypothetical protein